MAPDIRFGDAFFWWVAVVGILPVVYLWWNIIENRPGVNAWKISIICLACSSTLLFGGRPYVYARTQWIGLNASPARDVIPVKIINQIPALIVYKPVHCCSCGNAELPCSPYVSQNSKLAMRVPGELGRGFKYFDNGLADPVR
jgi:hypothetical protein